MTSMGLARWHGSGASVELGGDERPKPTERIARGTERTLLFHMPPIDFHGRRARRAASLNSGARSRWTTEFRPT